MKPEPLKADREGLGRIKAEAKRLHERGEWNKVNFLRLYREAEPMTGGLGDLLNFLVEEAEIDWTYEAWGVAPGAKTA